MFAPKRDNTVFILARLKFGLICKVRPLNESLSVPLNEPRR